MPRALRWSHGGGAVSNDQGTPVHIPGVRQSVGGGDGALRPMRGYTACDSAVGSYTACTSITCDHSSCTCIIRNDTLQVILSAILSLKVIMHLHIPRVRQSVGGGPFALTGVRRAVGGGQVALRPMRGYIACTSIVSSLPVRLFQVVTYPFKSDYRSIISNHTLRKLDVL